MVMLLARSRSPKKVEGKTGTPKETKAKSTPEIEQVPLREGNHWYFWLGWHEFGIPQKFGFLLLDLCYLHFFYWLWSAVASAMENCCVWNLIVADLSCVSTASVWPVFGINQSFGWYSGLKNLKLFTNSSLDAPKSNTAFRSSDPLGSDKKVWETLPILKHWKSPENPLPSSMLT